MTRTTPAKRAPLLAALGLCLIAGTFGGCDRCGARSAGTDAVPSEPADAALPPTSRPVMHATDLRSALILIHPEFRGARIESGRTALVRILEWPEQTSLLEALEPALKARGHQNISGDAQNVTARHPPMMFEAGRDGAQVTLGMTLPLDEETVGRILHSPSPMGTEHLGSLLPALPGAHITDEVYVMEIAYTAKPDRANFLVRSLMEDMQTLGWEPTAPLVGWDTPRLADGGVGPVPSTFDVTVVSPHTGGRLQIVRNAGEVKLRYDQPLAVRTR